MATITTVAAHFYSIKEEVRILGIDDGPFKRTDKDVLVVGTVFRGGRWLDGLMSTRAGVDGLDATDRLSAMVRRCRFKDLRVIMLDGIAVGGFNVVDMARLSEETGLGVIAVSRVMPDFTGIRSALRNLEEGDRRWALIEAAGKPKPVETRPGKCVFIQAAGIRLDTASAIVKVAATRSLLPEPIRAAHIIARGIVLGESKGKA